MRTVSLLTPDRKTIHISGARAGPVFARAGSQSPAVPAAGPIPATYTAGPDHAGMASTLAPIDGSFGYVHGPYAIVGTNTWRDCTVSARVVLPPAGPAGTPGAAVITHFQGFRGAAVSRFRGYELTVRSSGAWQVLANGPAAAVLASGLVPAARAYDLSLSTRGDALTARPGWPASATIRFAVLASPCAR